MYWTSIICNSYTPWTIEQIQPFMISLRDKRGMICTNPVEDVTIKKTVPVGNNKIIEKSTIRPVSVKKAQDPLFWSLFLAKYGETEYRRAFNNPNTEMKEKKKVADHFYTIGSGKATSDLIVKITKRGCNKIVEDIITQPKLLLSSLPAFCHYYHINIYIVDTKKKTYLEFLMNKHEHYENVILYRKQDKKTPEYFVDMPASTPEIQKQSLMNIRENLVGLISFEKSLKGVSSYKLSELHHLYTKLGMTDAPKKKQDLYEKILVHCVWE